MTKSDAEKLCADIVQQLVKENIVSNENKLHYAAERLNAPITMREVELIKEKDFSSQYNDAFRGVKYELTQQEESEQELLMKKKKKEKEEF